MKHKILFLAFAPILDGNGVANKILAQRDAFRNLGNDVVFCHFKTENGSTVAYLDDSFFFRLGGTIAHQFTIFLFFDKLACHVKKSGYDAIYIRYEKNANAGFIRFLRALDGVCIRIMEIPTYPYDSEIHSASLYRRLRLWEERYYRGKFSNCIDTIVTFTDYASIFGVKTLKISNAVDASVIKLRKETNDPNADISLIGVANLAFWHGYDRLLYGLKNYYNQGGLKQILFKIVGEGNATERARLKEIVAECDLKDKVHFYGNKSGEELDILFNQSNFAIGCLGCHRKDIVQVKSLKNVEYAMRGIPFVYSEINEDFDNKAYVYKVPADDSPINIHDLLNFISELKYNPSDIRADVAHLTWKKQMERVCSAIDNREQ